MVDAFPIRGNIDPQTFPFTLADLHRRGATGSLKVEGPAYPKALYFRAGRVLFGSSNDPRDQLGAILIENGKLTQDQLDEVNGKVGPGNPLAKILSDSGFVNQRELSEAARTKVERILADVVAYTSGSFEFEDGVLPKGAVDLKLATERLVIASVRRINDRAFVVRHIGGMDTILEPTPSLGGALAEIRAETGTLLDQLDGRSPLSAAAAASRMDEFEAAKVGCALLFLGLARRVQASPAAELDLAATAQMAFGGMAPADDGPFFVAEEPAELPAVSSDPFVLPPLPVADEAAPAEPFVLPAASSAGSLFVLPETPAPREPAPPPAPAVHRPTQPVPSVAPTEADLPPDIFRASGVGALPPPPRPFEIETVPTGFSPDPYLVPPDGSLSALPTGDPGPSFDEGPEAPPPSRPSKEDLAALDALLNPVGGRAAAPGSKSARPKVRTEWEPQFQVGARPPARGSGRPGPSRLLLVLAALAAIGLGGGAWHYLVGIPGVPPLPGSRPAPTPRPTITPRPALEPTPVPTLPPVAPTPGLPPSPGAEALPLPSDLPATPGPVPIPTREAPATPPAAEPSQTPARDLAGARRLLASGDFPTAARSFEAVLHTDAHRRFTIQVLVACVPETVLKAVAQVQSDELLLFSASINGRSCYRMAWGLYATDGEARAALATVPAYFRSGGSPKPQKLSNLFK